MATRQVHPKLVAICVLSSVFLLGDTRTAEAGCWLEKTRCTMSESLRGLAITVHSPKPATLQRNFTVSTRGQSALTERAVVLENPASAQTGLKMRKGAEGEIGDIALGLSDGGSLTVDLREDFLKIQYTLDF